MNHPTLPPPTPSQQQPQPQQTPRTGTGAGPVRSPSLTPSVIRTPSRGPAAPLPEVPPDDAFTGGLITTPPLLSQLEPSVEPAAPGRPPLSRFRHLLRGLDRFIDEYTRPLSAHSVSTAFSRAARDQPDEIAESASHAAQFLRERAKAHVKRYLAELDLQNRMYALERATIAASHKAEAVDPPPRRNGPGPVTPPVVATPVRSPAYVAKAIRRQTLAARRAAAAAEVAQLERELQFEVAGVHAARAALDESEAVRSDRFARVGGRLARFGGLPRAEEMRDAVVRGMETAGGGF
ncbi:hypothetical protein H9P43_008360 [Blastocladiella emersonii ATCC 22665]|nr:hypothetical protein H9P43_008360 [Blastocladiella emersonii ATCC 22665]